MNIYDFDNTIFKGDSSVKFIKYSLVRHPFIVLISIFKCLFAIITFKDFNIIKSKLFSFVKHIKNLEDYLDMYINRNMKNIKKLYLNNQKEDDIIISATFDFIIKRFCQKLNIKYYIATRYDIEKGMIIGNNCKGEEKVKQLYLNFAHLEVNEAYSDSDSDIPMLKLAKVAYKVKRDKLIKLNLNK